MARSDPQVNIRMPVALKEALEAVAAKAGRSLTTEMCARLEDSLKEDIDADRSRHRRQLLDMRQHVEDLIEQHRADMVSKPSARQDPARKKKLADLLDYQAKLRQHALKHFFEEIHPHLPKPPQFVLDDINGDDAVEQ